MAQWLKAIFLSLLLLIFSAFTHCDWSKVKNVNKRANWGTTDRRGTTDLIVDWTELLYYKKSEASFNRRKITSGYHLAAKTKCVLRNELMRKGL